MRNLLWVYETNKIQGRHFCKDLQEKNCKRFRRRQGQNQHILQSSILIENSKTTTESTVTDFKKKEDKYKNNKITRHMFP